MLELIFAFFVGGFLVIHLGRWIGAAVRRARFIRNVKQICEKHGYRFRRVRHPLASFFSVGELPDFVISAQKEYCVRLVTTVKSGRYFHFLDEQYAASYGRGGVFLPSIGNRKGNVVLPMTPNTQITRKGEKFHLFPPFRLPQDVEGRDDVMPILLFNPNPTQITTQVQSANGENQHAEPVTNGGKIGRFWVYAGSSFCDLLDGVPPVERKKNPWFGE